MTPKSPSPLIFVTPHFGREHGGVGRSAERIAGYLRTTRDVIVLTPSRTLPSGRLDRRSAIGLTVTQVGVDSDSKRNGQLVTDLVIAETRRAGATSVWACYVGALSYSAAVAAQFLGLPLVALARGNDIDLDIFGPDAFQIEHTLRSAEAVACVSSEMKHKVLAWTGGCKAVYVPNGVDPVEFPLMEPAPEAKSITIGLFGEVKLKKGLATLLEALDPVRFRLRIVGRLDDSSAKLLHGFLTLNPEWQSRLVHVPFLKKHLDLLEQYRSTDVLCIPSTHDGMPNVLLEGMSCGRIVIASEVGGALDVITHGLNGYLFPPGHSADLRRVLDTVASLDASKARSIADEGRRTVMEKFHWKQESQRYLQTLEEIKAA